MSWRAARAGLAYFALVFGAGFVLGVLRVTFLVPRLGERVAELAEMPVMLVVIWSAAVVVTRRGAVAFSRPARLGTGLLALVLMLAAELLLAVLLQERSLAEYVASRDPVSGSVYLAMLGLFALMPVLVGQVPRAGRPVVLNLAKLQAYERFGGDIDGYTRAGGGDPSGVTGADWALIDRLRQALHLVAAGQASDEFRARTERELRAATADDETRDALRRLAAGGR